MSVGHRFLCLLMALAAALPAAADSRKAKPAPEEKDKPKLTLTPNPAFGFTPLTVFLTGISRASTCTTGTFATPR